VRGIPLWEVTKASQSLISLAVNLPYQSESHRGNVIESLTKIEVHHICPMEHNVGVALAGDIE
jgi:hypothetical protein